MQQTLKSLVDTIEKNKESIMKSFDNKYTREDVEDALQDAIIETFELIQKFSSRQDMSQYITNVAKKIANRKYISELKTEECLDYDTSIDQFTLNML